MKRIVITGFGLISALGDRERSWQKLLNMQSGINIIQPFPELPPLPIALINQLNQQPSDLLDITEIILESALKDANLTIPDVNCAVVIGSSRGFQGDWEKAYQNLHQVITRPPRLPHELALTIAQKIGSQTAVLAPMAACATGLWCIPSAINLIASGACSRAIVGAVEAPITPLTLAGFHQLGALGKTGCYPFSRDREGLVLAEGGAIFVLETLSSAQSRGAKIYAEILGCGMMADAYHRTQLGINGDSMEKAIAQCLQRSGIMPQDIDYIHAHGTATELNDRFESTIINQIFGNSVAISSTKGATGHTLGASGALGIGFSLQALQNQILPPNVGLRSAEFDLNLITTPQAQKISHIMILSFGFGGQNVAICLKDLR